MSGPICEWDVSALSVRYMFLLCVICSCCALYVLAVTLGMRGPISECTVYVCWSLYHHSYHALGIEDPSLSGLCLP